MALAAVVAFLLVRDRAEPVTTAAQGVTLPAEPQPVAATTAPTSPGLPPPAPAGTDLNARKLALLEEMGLPRAVLVEVVLQDFHRRWDERSAALEKRYRPKPVPRREYLELWREREVEQSRELKALLGEDGYVAWDKQRTLASMNPGGIELSGDEAEQAYRLQKAFDEKHRELEIAMEEGIADPADAAALQELARQAFERDTEKLLGKERYDRMRGVTTPTADAAWKFAALNPTAEQASAAALVEQNYRAQEAALTKRLGQNAGNPVALAAELRALNDARDNELRRLFGADNFDSLQRQNDPTFQTLQQYAVAWELHDHDVRSVYDSLQAFHGEAQRLRSAAALAEAAGQRVNWAEIDASIDAARQQTESGLQRLIGPDRLRRLRQNGLLAPR